MVSNLSRVSGGCIGLYVSVASLPAHLRMTVSNASVYESGSPWRSRLTGFTSWVLFFELGDIVDSTVDNDPAESMVQWNRITAVGRLGETNQQSLSLLCLATSSPRSFCSFGC